MQPASHLPRATTIATYCLIKPDDLLNSAPTYVKNRILHNAEQTPINILSELLYDLYPQHVEEKSDKLYKNCMFSFKQPKHISTGVYCVVIFPTIHTDNTSMTQLLTELSNKLSMDKKYKLVTVTVNLLELQRY